MNSVEKGKKKKHSRSTVPTTVPIHAHTIVPTHAHTIVPTHTLTNLPTHNKNVLKENNQIDPVSYAYFDPVDPIPVPPVNNSMSDVDPTPGPIPPMNVSKSSTGLNAYFDPVGPVPVPLNQTYLNLASSTQTTVSNVETFVYLPIVLISAFVGIGFITYKRYQKRFTYTRIPDQDSYEI